MVLMDGDSKYLVTKIYTGPMLVHQVLPTITWCSRVSRLVSMLVMPRDQDVQEYLGYRQVSRKPTATSSLQMHR